MGNDGFRGKKLKKIYTTRFGGNNNILDLLEQYEAYLGLSDSGSLKSNDDYGIKSYENDQIGIMVLSGNKAGQPSYVVAVE